MVRNRKRSLGTLRMALCVALALALCAACVGAMATQTVTLPYAEPFLGAWESDLGLIPAYVEMGIEGMIVAVFQGDGTLATFLDGEAVDTFGFFIYGDFYVAVDNDGNAESSRYVFSEDGTQLDFYDLDGNHMITYTKAS